MKTSGISALLALMLSTQSVAQSPLESCEEIPGLAAQIISRRQINYDIMLMLNYIGGEFTDHPELQSWAQAMVDMAYAQPIPPEPDARTTQVETFVALWTRRCEESLP